MEEVCEQLDDVLVEVMTTLRELSQLRERYSEAVKEGYITMAQARHAMGGPRTVSSLQYDAVMNALTTTEIEEDTATSYDDLLKKLESAGECVEFKINRVVPGKPIKRARLTDSTDKSANSSGSAIRQRKKAEEPTKEGLATGEATPQGVEDVTKMTASWKLKDRDESETFESKEELKDPIKWFGILVPQSLRQSQQHFITVIEISGKLAGAQLRLETLRRRYGQLLEKKGQMKETENT